MCKMKIYWNDETINREIWHLQTNPIITQLYPNYLYIACHFNKFFSHASMIISIKVI